MFLIGGTTLTLSAQVLLVAPLSPMAKVPLPLKDSPEQLNPLLPEVYISTLFPLVARNAPLLVLARPEVMAQNLVQPHIPNLIPVLVIGPLLVLMTAILVPVAGVQPLTIPTLAHWGAWHTILLGLPQCLNIPARTSTFCEVGVPN